MDRPARPGAGERPRGSWGLSVLAGLLLLAVALLSIRSPRPDTGPPSSAPPAGAPAGSAPAPAAPAPAAEETPLLEIGGDEWSWKRSDDQVVVSGTVRNVSEQTLRNITAEVSFFDDGGRFLTSAEAFVVPNEVRAGQAVGFEIRAAWNPAIQDAKVSFQALYGYRIPTRWKEPR